MANPEAQARAVIDGKLAQSGWVVQHEREANLAAGRGVAIREFRLKPGHGTADYLLFVDRRPVGVLEAKKAGFTLTGVEGQARKYSQGLPDDLDAPVLPLPFCYLSTGVVTHFTNNLDPHPRARRIFQFHRPETLADWLAADNLHDWVGALHPRGGFYTAADDTKPASLRARLQTLPPLADPFLYDNQVRAVTGLEASLKADKPRALIQMTTGSGKTLTAITAAYRLIKFAGAGRVLFLVDRTELGEQAERAFQGYRAPDDNRLFTELYNVQRLQSPHIGASSKVVISTIQRLYAMLRGDPDFQEEDEQLSLFETAEDHLVPKEPKPVVYNAAIPPEFFDVIVVDECHRSIYALWRQVLEYFDAYLIGLTATPAKHTFAFFKQNLVMEYGHEEAVSDRVNVDFEIYRIRIEITERGATVEAGDGTMLGLRDRQTRRLRWQRPDEDLTYTGKDLDRSVVAEDQIRLIARTFRDKLPSEIFPGRSEVPKTLVFAKDDSHAEDIVGIFRQEFGRGNEFCRKITYKTTGVKPRDLIQTFRNSYQPRIAVTVDMVSTGTDIKAVEVVMFLRGVKSRILYEQMKGRGVRVIDEHELRSVTPDARAKTHFVIVDCVGITECGQDDTQPLERNKTVAFKTLLRHVASGGTDPHKLSSLASRLARLDKRLDEPARARIRQLGDGADLASIGGAIVAALDPDQQVAAAGRDRQSPQGGGRLAPHGAGLGLRLLAGQDLSQGVGAGGRPLPPQDLRGHLADQPRLIGVDHDLLQRGAHVDPQELRDLHGPHPARRGSAAGGRDQVGLEQVGRERGQPLQRVSGQVGLAVQRHREERAHVLASAPRAQAGQGHVHHAVHLSAGRDRELSPVALQGADPLHRRGADLTQPPGQLQAQRDRRRRAEHPAGHLVGRGRQAGDQVHALQGQAAPHRVPEEGREDSAQRGRVAHGQPLQRGLPHTGVGILPRAPDLDRHGLLALSRGQLELRQRAQRPAADSGASPDVLGQGQEAGPQVGGPPPPRGEVVVLRPALDSAQPRGQLIVSAIGVDHPRPEGEGQAGKERRAQGHTASCSGPAAGARLTWSAGPAAGW